MRDFASNIGPVQVVAPQVMNATTTSDILDLYGFNGAALVINTGAVVGSGDFTASLQESDTGIEGDFNDVEDRRLVGEFPDSLSADDVVKVGYIGFRRYIRVVLTKNSGTSIAVGAVLVKGHPADAPVA